MTRPLDIAAHGTLKGTAYTMTEAASRRWGAHETPGVEAGDMGEFRRALRLAIGDEADRTGRTIEVYAQMDDAQSWVVDVLEPRVQS